ncbi:MAG: hypothetical protein KDD35_10555, partial [Bdellovibrionales bacterium]|nr:hypothetical protein [Bdellovibrionales bacterium]
MFSCFLSIRSKLLWQGRFAAFLLFCLFFQPPAIGDAPCPEGAQIKERVLENKTKEQACETPSGEKLGDFRLFSPSGEILEEGFYLFDEKEGIWRSYFTEGSLHEETQWRSGRRDGSYTSYFENHHLQNEGSYRRGWKTAIWKHYLQDGSLKSYIDYGPTRMQIYAHYYGVRGDSVISHFTALDLTSRWPALFLDRLLVESGLLIGWVSGKNKEYVVTLAPEMRILWCIGPWFRIGPLLAYEKWPRLTSRASFGGRATFILNGTPSAGLSQASSSFNELVFTIKVLSKEYQLFMLGFDV